MFTRNSMNPELYCRAGLSCTSRTQFVKIHDSSLLSTERHRVQKTGKSRSLKKFGYTQDNALLFTTTRSCDCKIFVLFHKKQEQKKSGHCTKFCQILSTHDFLVICLRCRTQYTLYRYPQLLLTVQCVLKTNQTKTTTKILS